MQPIHYTALFTPTLGVSSHSTAQCRSVFCKARQGKARQAKARQGKARERSGMVRGQRRWRCDLCRVRRSGSEGRGHGRVGRCSSSATFGLRVSAGRRGTRVACRRFGPNHFAPAQSAPNASCRTSSGVANIRVLMTSHLVTESSVGRFPCSFLIRRSVRYG